MRGLSEYIEKSLEKENFDKILLKFQRSLLEDGKELERRTKKAGLKDETVLPDLFKSLHPDILGEYAVFRKAELKKNKEKLMHKIMLIGTPIYFLVMTAVYLAFSFHTGDWHTSWLIVIGFVTFWVDVVGVAFVAEISSKRKLMHPIARVLLGFSIMMTTVCVFLFGLTLSDIQHFWVVFPAGVMILLFADAVFAYKTKQMLRNINYIIYIVASAAMLFIVLGGISIIPWHPGWIMVPLSLIIDVVYVAIRLVHNRKYTYRPEEEE